MKDQPTGTMREERVSGTGETREGETVGLSELEAGYRRDRPTGAGRPSARATARRSTGINPAAENPIDPRMPAIFPA